MPFEDIRSLVGSIPGTQGRPDYSERLYHISESLASTKLIVEIGSFVGGSSICLAHPHLMKHDFTILCIDLRYLSYEELNSRSNEFAANDLADSMEAQMRDGTFLHDMYHHIQFVRGEGRIIPIPGFSEDVYARFDHRPVDICYIDGSHQYEAVKKDVRFLEDVRIGGYAIFDDWINVVEQAVNEYFSSHGGGWKLVDDQFPRWFRRDS